MKRNLFGVLLVLVILVPLNVFAADATATQVDVASSVNNDVFVNGSEFHQEFNGPTGITKSLSGGVTAPYLNMQQATTPFPVGSWRPVVLAPRSTRELYTEEEVRKIIESNQDIFQVTGRLRLVVPAHNEPFIYTLPSDLNLDRLGLVSLLTVEGEAPPNANVEEHLLRLQSVAYRLTNSFVTMAQCTEDILNKFANNGGGISGGATGFMGSVLTGTGIAAQDSVAVSRAYRVPKCRVTAWSTNVSDLDEFTKQSSGQQPELLYNLYLYKDKGKQQAEFAGTLSRMAEDEQFLARLRRGGGIDFVAFYLKEADKAAVQEQIEVFQKEFVLLLKAKGVTAANARIELFPTDPNAPAYRRTDIVGGLALYQ